MSRYHLSSVILNYALYPDDVHWYGLFFSQVLQSDPFQMVKWPFLGLKWPRIDEKGHFEEPGDYDLFSDLTLNYPLVN